MRKTFISIVMTFLAVVVMAENLLTNGDFSQSVNYVPRAVQMKEKGLEAQPPWPKNWLADLSSTPGTFKLANEVFTITSNDINGKTSFYSTVELKPGSYSLQFKASGTKGNLLRIMLYCYDENGKWSKGVTLRQISTAETAQEYQIDFSEKSPEVKKMCLAYGVSGSVNLSQIKLSEKSLSSVNVLKNGDFLEKRAEHVQQDKLEARGFKVEKPWVNSWSVDIDSKPGTFSFSSYDVVGRALKILAPEGFSSVYSDPVLPGNYKVKLKAKSDDAKAKLQILIYRYGTPGKNYWMGSKTLELITPSTEWQTVNLNFIENDPDVKIIRLVLRVLGSAEVANISMYKEELPVSIIGKPGDDFVLKVSGEESITNNTFKSWTFPAITKPGRVIWEFEHRIDSPSLSGWAPCVQLEVNNTIISGMADREQSRILNKGLFAPVYCQFGPAPTCNEEKWYSLYAPDFESPKKGFEKLNSEACKLKLDITDLVSSSKDNTVRIRFGIAPLLFVDNLKVYQEEQPSLLSPKVIDDDKYIKMAALKPVSLKAEQQGNDKVLVKIGNQTIPVTSSFASAEKNFSVKRVIKVETDHIKVFDTFTNHSDDLIGIRIRNQVAVSRADTIWLAGDPAPINKNKSGGRNPSVFIGKGNDNLGIGLVDVDDVSRVQSIQYCSDGFAGIGSDTFALSSKESRTAEWSIYPVNSHDYFDFINRVRRNWDVNFTIDGSFNFSMGNYSSWKPEHALEFAHRLGLTRASFGVLFWSALGPEYSKQPGAVHGFGLMLDEIRSRGANPTIKVAPMRKYVHKLLKRCKEITPDLKRYIYVHNQYSQELDDLEQYADCILTEANGQPFSLMKEHYRLFIPTKENKFGKKNLEFLKYLLDNYDLDGIYNDEFNYTHRRITYNMWDKVSVELDDNNKVIRKIGFVPLLKLDYSMEALRYVIEEREKGFVANFSPETRSELKYKFLRFEETFYPSWVYLSHLYSPVQLGDMTGYGSSNSDILEDIRNAIKRGVLYLHYVYTTKYPTITAKMYPFTPVELHNGYLVGKERILTVYSGEFGISGEQLPYKAFVYDEVGVLQKDYPYENIKTADGIKCKIILKKNYCAALVKGLPL